MYFVRLLWNWNLKDILQTEYHFHSKKKKLYYFGVVKHNELSEKVCVNSWYRLFQYNILHLFDISLPILLVYL